MNHFLKRTFSLFLALALCLSLVPILPAVTSAAETETLATFELGSDGSASHSDGSSKTTYTETDGEYTLSITNGVCFYTGARDAKGNSCFKLGTSSKVGSFQFAVPDDVTEVVICVAKYKAKTSKITVNDTTHTLTNSSDDGVYDEIVVDTTSTKTVSFTTVSGGVRAMVNTIVFNGTASDEGGDTSCTHANTTTTTVDATCTTAGSTTVTCDDCGNTVSTESIPATGHSYVDGICSTCSAAEPETPAGYVLTDLANITSTQNVIITMSKDNTVWALSSANGTSAAPTAVVVTVENGVVTGNYKDIYWNIVNDNGNLTIYPAGTTDTWLYCTSANNGVRVGTNSNSAFTIDSSSGYLKNTATSRFVGVYTTNPDWRCYTNTTGNTAGQTLAFYAQSAATSDCQHTNTTTTTVNATCTEAGSTTVTCDDCGETVSTTTIEATGHSYENGVCTACGAEQPASSEEYWVLVTDASWLKAGEQVVIVAKDTAVALSTTQNTNNRGQVAVTKNDDNTVTINSEVQILTLEDGKVDGTFALHTGSGYLYAASGSANHLKVQDTLTENSSWSISIDGTGNATVVAQGTNSRNWMRHNAQNSLFSCYASGQQDICLYMLTDCVHTNKTATTVDPTCTEAGSTTIVCDDCGDTVSVTAIAALGHDWGEWTQTTAPTCTEAGEKSHTCSVCSTTETEAVEATGHQNVTEVTEEATCTEAGSVTATCNDCGDVTVTPIAAKGHSSAYIINGDGTHDYACPACGTVEIDNEACADEDNDYLCDSCTYFINASPIDYSGNYYIAARESEGSVFYFMTNQLDEQGEIRYKAEESQLTELPEAFGDEEGKTFTFTRQENGTYLINVYGLEDAYLTWVEGSTSLFVPYEQAAAVFMERQENGSFHIYYAADVLRYLALNKSNKEYFSFYRGASELVDLYLMPTDEYVAQVGDQKFTTLAEAEAAEAAVTGAYVKILVSNSQDMTVTTDMYLDLNGCSLYGSITVNEGCTLYGMDNTTDDYDCSDGYGEITDVTGTVETQFKTNVTGLIRRYVTYTDFTTGAVSFHRVYVGITSMTLRPGAQGVGYKATYAGDEKVAQMLGGYGYNIWLEGYEQYTYTGGVDASKFKVKECNVVSALLKNFDVENFSQTSVYATAYITVNGETITSSEYSYTLRGMIERIAEELENGTAGYSDTQLSALQAMCQKFESLMSQWENIDNILTWTAA